MAISCWPIRVPRFTNDPSDMLIYRHNNPILQKPAIIWHSVSKDIYGHGNPAAEGKRQIISGRCRHNKAARFSLSGYNDQTTLTHTSGIARSRIV